MHLRTNLHRVWQRLWALPECLGKIPRHEALGTQSENLCR